MNTNDQGPVSLKLRGLGAEFHVTSMVLWGEVARLPTLLVIVSPETGFGTAPEVDAGPYTLHSEKNGLRSTPFGVTSWFVQSVAKLTGPQHRTAYSVYLGILSGQDLPLSGYAVDGQPFTAVIQQMCNRYLGQRTIESQFSGGDSLLGAVVSFGETFEQFLRRMALAADTWVWAKEMAEENGLLRLFWQERLQGYADPDEVDWATVCVAERHCAAPGAVRTFWPRGTITHMPALQPSGDLRTLELMNPLPLPTDAYEKTATSSRVWQSDFYLSDNLVHAGAWPGLRVEEDNVIVAAIHVYDEGASGEVRRLLGPLVPGMRAGSVIPTLAADAAFGMLAISTKAGGGYTEAMTAIDRLQMRHQADAIAAGLGIQASTPQAANTPSDHSPHLVLASVCPWDVDVSPTWAAGGTGGTAKHTTEIKVCFDWSDVPVRVPYAYPMSGGEGVLFYPPSAGDRVLVLFDRMWPLVACHAYQGGDALLPGVLRHGADIDTLSAQRGIVVKGGMIFRTAANGDLVIHAAGNLVLRAEKDIFLDGQHLREHGRAAAGHDDSARQVD